MKIRARLRALFNRSSAESDLDDELRFHLDMETEHQMRMGLPENEARRRAQMEFGGVERYRDESRDARGVAWIEDVFRDLKVSLRSLRRAPAFALVSICTVALGVGTTTAVFSLVDGILLRPLPYPSADRLLRIYERTAKFPNAAFTAPNFADMERQTRTLQTVAFFSTYPQTVLGLDEPVRITAASVSPRFFDVLAIRPLYGRTLLPADDHRGGMQTNAVISERFWRARLGARGDWSTMLLHVDGATARIVGIMPAAFNYPTDVDLWVATGDDNPSRTSHNWSVIARLKPGLEAADTQLELDRLFGGLHRQLGKDMDAEGVTIWSLRDALTVRVRTLMYVLLAAVALVLLVACSNLASANLARGESQQREIAVRASLGAGRGRLVRQLVAEKVLLATVGGATGVALAWVLVRVAVAMGPGTLPAFATVQVDWRVMTFGVAIAMITGVVTGAIPAMSITGDLRSGIASGGGGAGRRRGFSAPLIATEIAVATMLLIGAGLFVRSFKTLTREDPGYRVRQILVADVDLPEAGYANRSGGYGDTIAIPRFFDAVVARLRAQSRGDAIAVINQIPLGTNSFGSGFMIDGGTEANGQGDYRVVDSAYFGTMGIPMLRGRGFTRNDRSGAQQVTIINREAAEKFWPGINPLGHRIRLPGMDLHKKEWLTIVGVVENVRQYALDLPVSAQVYVPYAQRPERLQRGSLVVRTGNAATAATQIRDAVREADPNVLVKLTSMEALVDQSLAARKFSMTVLSTFSALALFLAAIGIYGVLAYAVVQRQREIGVRMALGSTSGGVRRLIVGDAMRAVVPGLIVGLIVALFAVRFVRGMLYGIAPVDPLTFIITPAAILAVSVAASLWPASRAARIDPMIAMRAE